MCLHFTKTDILKLYLEPNITLLLKCYTEGIQLLGQRAPLPTFIL